MVESFAVVLFILQMISRSDDVLAGLCICFLFSRMSVARLIGLCGFAWARSTYRRGLAPCAISGEKWLVLFLFKMSYAKKN